MAVFRVERTHNYSVMSNDHLRDMGLSLKAKGLLSQMLSPLKIGTGKKDEAIVAKVLESMHISHLADRVYTELSGGERQMVLIARALAQEPQIMILDEPTFNLDFGNQIKVLQEIKRLSQKGLCIIMTTHIPNHAFLCDAEVLLFQRERPYMLGCSNEIITEQNMPCPSGTATPTRCL